jgi:hypothetical protein
MQLSTFLGLYIYFVPFFPLAVFLYVVLYLLLTSEKKKKIQPCFFTEKKCLYFDVSGILRPLGEWGKTVKN